MSMTPLWFAVAVGVLVGWAWKPHWVNLDGAANWAASIVPTSSALPSLSGIGIPIDLGSVQNFTSVNFQLPGFITWNFEKEPSEKSPDSRALQPSIAKSYVLTEKDFLQLHQLLEEEIDGPGWIKVMERSTANLKFIGHRRNSEEGHLMYRTISLYEDVTPEILRDFFWDDEFRSKWDAMHFSSDLLEECTKTGAMLVHWIRKFPYVSSYRDYTIARRIWQSSDSYYCVCKGVPCSHITRRENAKLVDEFLSCWRIRPANSARDGRLTASEVTLFHCEDMGMPRAIAKFGVENGMWGTVKRIDPGLRQYLRHRASDPPLSRYVLLARLSTKFSLREFDSHHEKKGHTSSSNTEAEHSTYNPPTASSERISKLVVCGALLVLACSFDGGFLKKAIVYGVGRRFGQIGGRAAAGLH
ncbi:unnamed protein product [Cuscuta campestris]|nr:unnamed protein product [Cuscuta campestris]